MFKFMNLDRFGPMKYREEGGSDGGSDGGSGGDDSAAKIAKLQETVDSITANLTTVTEERDRYKTKHDEAEKHRKLAEKKAAEEAAEAARKAGNVDAIEASWKEKLDAANNESASIISGLEKTIQDVTSGAAATALATELSVDGTPDALKPHIRPRLTTEMRDGKPHVVVLKDGKPSALTMDDLKSEIESTKFLAPLIKGSDASGTGGAGGDGSSGKGAKTIKRSAFDSLTPGEKSKKMKDGFSVVDD